MNFNYSRNLSFHFRSSHFKYASDDVENNVNEERCSSNFTPSLPYTAIDSDKIRFRQNSKLQKLFREDAFDISNNKSNQKTNLRSFVDTSIDAADEMYTKNRFCHDSSPSLQNVVHHPDCHKKKKIYQEALFSRQQSPKLRFEHFTQTHPHEEKLAEVGTDLFLDDMERSKNKNQVGFDLKHQKNNQYEKTELSASFVQNKNAAKNSHPRNNNISQNLINEFNAICVTGTDEQKSCGKNFNNFSIECL